MDNLFYQFRLFVQFEVQLFFEEITVALLPVIPTRSITQLSKWWMDLLPFPRILLI